MQNRHVLGSVLSAMVGVLLGALPAAAAPPWESLLSFKRVDADSKKTYKLSQDDGPWLILAATFSGDGAEDQARDLVLELRQRYKWPAYIHKMEFDLDDDLGGRNVDQLGRPAKWRYQRGSEIEEIAVLVGNFASIDDPEAKETLKQIKFAQPDCLDLNKTKRTNQSLAAFRFIQQKMLRSGANRRRGPMGHAFMVPNPMRKGQFSNESVDAFVVKMNEGLEHSLLKCPGKYTVQVAHFAGKVVVDQDEIRKIQRGEKQMTESRLDEAADMAHRLTEALRQKGYEAYEFHTRQASIVTIGSFDSVGTPRPDGKIEIHPTIFRIIETFKGKQNAMGGPMMGQTIIGIPLDVQPGPVIVPKPSLGASYAGQSRGLW